MTQPLTNDLVPAELIGLPKPWNLTSDRARRAALAAGGAAGAPAALDQALQVLPGLVAAEPPDEALPEGLGEYFDFTADWLAEAMPTLDDASLGGVAALLRERSGGEPDPRETVALGQRWLASVARQLASSALDVVDVVDEPAAEAMVDVVRRHLGRLPADTATLALAKLGGAGHRAAGLLAETAADEAADPAVRQQAEAMLRWLADLPPAGGDG